METTRIKYSRLVSAAKKHEKMFLQQLGKSVHWSSGLQIFCSDNLIETEADTDYCVVKVGWGVSMAKVFDDYYKDNLA